jgi:hypothetical protein
MLLLPPQTFIRALPFKEREAGPSFYTRPGLSLLAGISVLSPLEMFRELKTFS